MDILFLKKLQARNDGLKFQWGHINFSGVNEPAEMISAWSMTLLKPFSWGHAEIGSFSGNIDPTEISHEFFPLFLRGQ
jgi:hypothetical protein